MIRISQDQARLLQLAAQGLLTPPARAATPAAVVRCIERMALLQIDTIHVVARSPYLVLFSRLGAYRPEWLDRALAQGRVFETWAHEACFAPHADLMLHRSYNQASRRHWGLAHGERGHQRERAHLDRLLAHIEGAGPVKSSDFQRPEDARGAGGWWGWKDEKRWLEALFARGELMVSRRDNFQRVYDLSHRVVPGLGDKVLPSADAAHRAFQLRSVAALGITQARWVHDYFRTRPRLRDADLEPMVDAGELLRVEVEDWAAPGYVHASMRPLLNRIRSGTLAAGHSTLLSPFDPIVWDRERASAMFGFDYRIECYTPEHRRIHGYFVLPVLRRGRLVARLDAKAHRADGEFEVRAFHVEADQRPDEAWWRDVAQAVTDCARWHGTPRVRLSWSGQRPARSSLRAQLLAIESMPAETAR